MSGKIFKAGHRFFRLQLVEIAYKNKYGHNIWKCLCDCGKYVDVYIGNLARAHRQVKSCGCLKKEGWSKQIWEVEFNKWNRQRQRRGYAERRESSLSFEEWKTLVQSDCTYCGAPPSIKTHVGKEFRNTIDRVDSSDKYRLKNCVTACYICNTSKRDMTKEAFINMVKAVYKHLKL